MIETAVYLACGVMSVICAIALYRSYRHTRSALLLWSSLAFAALAINNIILVVDLVIIPDVDFSGPFLRNVFAAIAGTLLLFGLIWELT